MQIKMMQLGMVGTNCYIFWDENTKCCAVVDPGDHGERIAQAIGDLGLEPVAVLLTHSHFDHILGIPGLRSVWPELPVYCHPADIDERKTVTLFGSTKCPCTPLKEKASLPMLVRRSCSTRSMPYSEPTP